MVQVDNHMGIGFSSFMPLRHLLANFRILRMWLLLTPLLLVSPQVSASELVNFSPELLQRVEAKWGAAASKRLQALRTLVEQNRDISEMDKLKLVNDFFNLVPYYTDQKHWGVEDYWATPFEKLTTFGGDCEDYSIAKYFALRELGVDDGKLRITYVKALDWDEAHMVLTYAPSPRTIPVVLDNLNPVIKPANERRDLVPVYSFNVQGLWLAKERGSGQYVGGSDRIGQWTELLGRLAK